MFYLGVLDFQIGLLLGLGRLLQMFFALVGGIVTDKFGRRLVTVVGDTVSWSFPVLIWAFSQNFWWFLAAALVNSTWQITAVSWECLWIDEEAENAEKLAKIFNWIYIGGQLAVFFAPIAGFFVDRYSLVPVMRVLFVITFFSMTAKFIIFYIFTEETETGRLRMQETKSTSLTHLMLDYKVVFRQIMLSWKMMRALALQAALGVTIMITSTFFALYATQNLNIPVAFMAYLPIIRAGVMLIFLFFIQSRLSIFKPRHIMIAGIFTFVAANIFLLSSPAESPGWLVFYTFIEACAIALLMPRLDTLVANAIDPKERARIRSLFNASILAVTAVFGFASGILSNMDRRLPFVLNIALFGVMFITLLAKREK